MFENIIPCFNERTEKISVFTVFDGEEREKSVCPVGKDAYLKVKFSRQIAVIQFYASFYNENGYIATFCGSFLETENGMDVYTVRPTVIFEKSDVYFVKFDCNTPYGKKYFSFCGNEGVFSENEGSPYQLLITDDKYPVPSWFGDGIIYHIFVDRFYKGADCPKREDAVYFADWYNDIPEYPKKVGGFLRNNTFFGGNIWGVIEKLDYIQSLGTGTIYLSPIFKAYSNHKYDTGDYLCVDEGFGGDEALDALLSECKKRKINVILDGVFNHVGEDSIYFNKYGKYNSVGAYQSKNSEYYSWFNFIDYPDEYDSWWGIKNLPKVNKISEFKNFICEKVVPKYMKKGISGWRLDVADELDSLFLKQISKSVKSEKKDAVVVGEVWEDASCKEAYGELKHYFDGERLDSVTNYPLRNGLISFLKTGNSSELKNVLRTLNSHYPQRQHNLLMNILGTHDTERILTALGGNLSDGYTNSQLAVMKMTPEQFEKAKKLLILAYSLLITLPGVPCLYYGDEAGIEGYHDPFNRRTFPWGAENAELKKTFSVLGNIRKNKYVLKNGKFRLFDSDDEIFAFERYDNKDSVIVVCNLSSMDISLPTKNSYVDLINNTEYPESIKVNANSLIIVERKIRFS